MEDSIDSVAEAHLGLTPDTPDDTRITLSAGALRAALAEAYAQSRSTNSETSPLAERESSFFRQLMDSLPDFVYFKDRDSRFICVNKAHAERMGLSGPDEAVGKSDFDFFAKEDAEEKFATEQEIMRTGNGFPPTIERDFRRGTPYWALTTKHPLRDANGEIRGTFGLSRDVTAELDAKQDLAEQHRLLETLINVLPCRIFVRDREHRFRLINDEYKRNLQITDSKEIIGHRFDDFLQGQRVERVRKEDEEVMRTGKPILRRVEFDTSPLDQGRWLSVSKVPLRKLDGEIEGLVGVSFDITVQKEAEAQAMDFGRALKHRNEQMESELALARKLQTTLATFRFPKRIELAGHTPAQAGYFYRPSKHVAGDFFQIFDIDDHRFGAFICDVMGHGVRSALVTAVVRGLLEEKRTGMGDPAKLFGEINDVLFRLAEDPDFPRFVTASFALFDVSTHTIQVVCAGHPPLLAAARIDGKRHCRKLAHEREPALGLVNDYVFHTTTHPLDDDTLFLLYTDGLTEERNAEGIEFGIEGVARCLESLGHPSAEQLIKSLREGLTKHAGSPQFSDDVCAVAITFTP